MSTGPEVVVRSFEGQDWSVPETELLNLSRAHFGWSDDDVWRYSCVVDLNWDPEDTVKEEEAAARDVKVVEKRLKELAEPFLRVAVALRLQGTAGEPPVSPNVKLLTDLRQMFIRIEKMMETLNEDSALAMDQGDWSDFFKACEFFWRHVCCVKHIKKRLQSAYGVPTYAKLENQYLAMWGHWHHGKQ